MEPFFNQGCHGFHLWSVTAAGNIDSQSLLHPHWRGSYCRYVIDKNGALIFSLAAFYMAYNLFENKHDYMVFM